MKNLTVCILLITVIVGFLFIDNSKDFLCVFCCSAVIYIFGFFFVESVLFYIQKKRTENLAKDIDKLLDEHFLLKIKNELQLTHNYKQLHTD